jgi:hypothetical protein
MSATGLTALTLLVGLFGGLIYWWGERSNFPWMKFGAAAALVIAIGVAVATWPDHHVVANAGAQRAGSLQGGPSLSPSASAPGTSGTALSRSDQVSGQSASGDSAPPGFTGTVPIFGVPGFPPEPVPSPKPTHSHTPTPTPSPSVTQSETPSPTPTESETPSPTPTESETPSPTPTESETPSPTPSESETPSPSPTEPSPSPTILPEPSPTPGFRLF